ncbi:MAG: hypothetical protein BMS9Abin37_2041 [Acidobacteriota bacterium]|nr:MAG: hypothetical protein BMS9Abin37_2041 [Acidobacteriota bacterium]
MMMKGIIVISALMLAPTERGAEPGSLPDALAPSRAFLQRKYHIVVTQEATDLYRVDYSSPIAYVVTENCMEIAYYDDAILDVYDRSIYFVERGVECYVRAVR